MQLFAKLKKILRRGFRSHLKFKVALKPPPPSPRVPYYRKLSGYSFLREKVLELPYVSRLLPLPQSISSFLSPDEEAAAASKRMEV